MMAVFAMRDGFGKRIVLPPLLAALAACATPAAEPRSAAADAALINEAAATLDRYCVGGLPDVEAIAIAMSADAGPATGKAYTPYAGPQGFIGASLRTPDGVSASVTQKEDGAIVCGVALFTQQVGAFETAVMDRLTQRSGVELRDPQRDAKQGTTYTLDGFPIPATLSLRPRATDQGENAIGAVITVAADGGLVPEPEVAQPVAVAAVVADETPAPAAAEPATPEPSVAEPAAPAEIALQTPAAASGATAAAAPTSAPPTAAVAPAPVQPFKPAPSLPKAENPPALAQAPSLYEGAPYAAFSPQQIAEFCKQDWRTRRLPGGRTEYNPCYERGAFR